MKNFDLIIIGSGSGLEVSSEAADRGLSVAVVEPGPFGGTCLNRGCIPSKMLIHSADVVETIRRANLFGITAAVSAIDWEFIYHAMPQAVFASPQVGSVGLTEREAKERGIPYAVGRYDYIDTAYGSSIEDKDGFAKVLVHRETGEVLGGHIIGSEASILVQEIANAMRLRLTSDAFAQAIYVHPALPEVVQRAFGAIS